MERHFISNLFILSCLAFAVAQQTQQQCYFPDQSIAAGYIACNSTTKGTQTSASACCLAQDNSYCTDSGLCYTDGLLYRGGCTDVTWAAPGCPNLCTNALRRSRAGFFVCDLPSDTFQCGTPRGQGDCTRNFSLPRQHIVLRDDQQPGAANQVNYTNPGAAFISRESTVPDAPNSKSSTESSSDVPASLPPLPSNLAVGLSLGLTLGILLLTSLVMNILQYRHYQINLQRHAARPKTLTQRSTSDAFKRAPYPGRRSAATPIKVRRLEQGAATSQIRTSDTHQMRGAVQVPDESQAETQVVQMQEVQVPDGVQANTQVLQMREVHELDSPSDRPL